MRVAIVGSRDCCDYYGMAEKLWNYDITHIISGGAPGIDTLAEHFAENNDIPTTIFHAEWKKFGNSAGPKRNKKMIEEGKPELVIAFNPGIGTNNAIYFANKAGIPVKVYRI